MTGNVKAVITLLIITILSGAALGYVYELTKTPIETQNLAAKENAFKEVFKEAVGFEQFSDVSLEEINGYLNSSDYEFEKIEDLLIAKDSTGNNLGYVMQITTQRGYGGDISLSLGIDNDGTVKGISILTINETAGLGMNANTPEFTNQFADKNVAFFTFTKNEAKQDYEIDALSGATITTTAVVNAVNAGIECYKTFLGGAKL